MFLAAATGVPLVLWLEFATALDSSPHSLAIAECRTLTCHSLFRR